MHRFFRHIAFMLLVVLGYRVRFAPQKPYNKPIVPFGGSGVKPAPPVMRVITDGGWLNKFDTGPQVRDMD